MSNQLERLSSQWAGEETIDPFISCARLASEDAAFQAMDRAALKARASKLGPGDIVKIGIYEFTVDEDDRRGVVVQMVLDRDGLMDLAARKARDLSLKLPSEGPQRMEWMNKFVRELVSVLSSKDITCLPSPGMGMAFERTAYKGSPEIFRDV